MKTKRLLTALIAIAIITSVFMVLADPLPNDPAEGWVWVNSTDTSGAITYTKANDGANDIGFWTASVWGNPSTNGGIVSYCNYYTPWGYDFNTVLCKFTFTGAGVRWYSRRSMGTGNVEVYIDGELKDTVDLYKTYPEENDYLAYELTNIPYGAHTLELKGTSSPTDETNQYTLLPVVGFEYSAAEDIPDFKVTEITAESGSNRTRVMFNNILHPTYIINAINRDPNSTVTAPSTLSYRVDPAAIFFRGSNYISFHPESAIIDNSKFGLIKDIYGRSISRTY